MSLIWAGLPQRDEQPYVIPPRRITDRLPVLQPKGMTTFVCKRVDIDSHCPDCPGEPEDCVDSHLHERCGRHAEEHKAEEAEFWSDYYRGK